MSAPDTRLAAMADRLIKTRGREVVLVRTGAGDFDPLTGQFTAQEVTETIRAVVLDYQATEVDGTLVHQGDKRALISARALVDPPAVEDAVLDGGRYEIAAVTTIAPGEVPLIYDCALRR